MTFAQLKDNHEKVLSTFREFDVDTQLALLWYIYEKMGKSITPAAPGAAEPPIAEGLYNQVKELSREQQLEVQRNLLRNTDTRIGREYGSLSDNTRLLFWYRLAQGMEAGAIVPMPENYQLPENAKTLLAAVESLSFDQQITFLRNAVSTGGAAPKPGAEI